MHSPKPIRKRGYHRALKSNKPWALIEKGMFDNINKLCYDMYAPKIWNDIFTDNALLGLSAWVPHTNEIDFFGVDRTMIPIRFNTPVRKSLWSRLKSWFIR